MICRCGAHFCFVCGRDWQEHINQPGGLNFYRCKLPRPSESRLQQAEALGRGDGSAVDQFDASLRSQSGAQLWAREAVQLWYALHGLDAASGSNAAASSPPRMTLASTQTTLVSPRDTLTSPRETLPSPRLQPSTRSQRTSKCPDAWSVVGGRSKNLKAAMSVGPDQELDRLVRFLCGATETLVAVRRTMRFAAVFAWAAVAQHRETGPLE